MHCQVVLQCDLCLAQGLDGRHERVLKGLNTTLAWLQECIVLSGVLQSLLFSPKLLLSKIVLNNQLL